MIRQNNESIGQFSCKIGEFYLKTPISEEHREYEIDGLFLERKCNFFDALPRQECVG